MSDKEAGSEKKDAAVDLSAMLGMGGLFEGVSNILSKFGELAERGESLQKTMGGQTESGKAYQSSAGFSVKFGTGGADRGSSTIPPVSPLTKDRPTNKSDSKSANNASKVPPKREPNVDLFEEEDRILLVAEMPGVPTDAVELEFTDKQLQIKGMSKTAVFEKSMELPRAYTQEQVSITANNGIIEICLKHN